MKPREAERKGKPNAAEQLSEAEHSLVSTCVALCLMTPGTQRLVLPSVVRCLVSPGIAPRFVSPGITRHVSMLGIPQVLGSLEHQV